MKQLKFKRSIKVIAFFASLLFSVLVSAQKQKVSCVGNSITYGYDLSNPSTQSYPG